MAQATAIGPLSLADAIRLAQAQRGNADTGLDNSSAPSLPGSVPATSDSLDPSLIAQHIRNAEAQSQIQDNSHYSHPEYAQQSDNARQVLQGAGNLLLAPVAPFAHGIIAQARQSMSPDQLKQLGLDQGRYDESYDPAREIGSAAGNIGLTTMGASGAAPIIKGAVTGGAEGAANAVRNLATHDPNSAKMFLGESAAETNDTVLRDAKKLVAQGVDPLKVKQATGWEQDIDGNWVREIADNKASLKPMMPDIRYDLQDVLDHPELFKNYPELRTMQVTFNPRRGGASFIRPVDAKPGDISRASIELGVPSKGDDQLSTLMHEIQHAIQHREILPSGGDRILSDELRPIFMEGQLNVLSSRDLPYYERRIQLARDILAMPKATDAIKQEAQKALDLFSNMYIDGSEKLDRYQSFLESGKGSNDWRSNYERLAGEVQARNTGEERLKMDLQQRRNSLAQDTEKGMDWGDGSPKNPTPRDTQIITYRSSQPGIYRQMDPSEMAQAKTDLLRRYLADRNGQP